MLLSFFIWHYPSILWMGVALVTKRVVNACPRSAILVVHFIVEGVAVFMAKLGTRRSASVYRGEWACLTRGEAFKDKARLQLHSKNFGLKQVLFVRY